MNIRNALIAFGGVFGACVALSSFHPWGNLRGEGHVQGPLLAGVAAPRDVRQVLETKCVDCHSLDTHWPLYSRLAPGSWLIERDVHEGRARLNFSEWQRYSTEMQIDLLVKIGSEARSGEMPVKQYLILHPDAKLTPEEQELIYTWTKSQRKQLKQNPPSQPDESPAN